MHLDMDLCVDRVTAPQAGWFFVQVCLSSCAHGKLASQKCSKVAEESRKTLMGWNVPKPKERFSFRSIFLKIRRRLKEGCCTFPEFLGARKEDVYVERQALNQRGFPSRNMELRRSSLECTKSWEVRGEQLFRVPYLFCRQVRLKRLPKPAPLLGLKPPLNHNHHDSRGASFSKLKLGPTILWNG